MAKGIFTHLANEDMLDEIALPNTDNSNINNLIWVAFIVMNTLSILGLNRFIMQIIYF